MPTNDIRRLLSCCYFGNSHKSLLLRCDDDLIQSSGPCRHPPLLPGWRVSSKRTKITTAYYVDDDVPRRQFKLLSNCDEHIRIVTISGSVKKLKIEDESCPQGRKFNETVNELNFPVFVAPSSLLGQARFTQTSPETTELDVPLRILDDFQVLYFLPRKQGKYFTVYSDESELNRPWRELQVFGGKTLLIAEQCNTRGFP